MKILKKFSSFFIILSLFLFISFNSYPAFATPTNMNINTDTITLNKVYYDNFSIIAKKITSSNSIGYCLEIDKVYPDGELFVNKGTINSNIINILAYGYPNKSASDLNLTSDDDAYFATQIAIWSFIEGYDVSKISSDNSKIVTAIKSIYNNALIRTDYSLSYNINLFSNSENIQDVIILSKLEEQSPSISTDDNNIINGK